MAVVTRPKCLILYTDDNAAHRHCVQQLAVWLNEHGACEVLLDMWAFDPPYNGREDTPHTDAARTPLEWWMWALESADRVVVVFSEGTRLAFNGRHLKRASDRHWENMFATVITMLLNVR